METSSIPEPLGGAVLPSGVWPLEPDDPAAIGGHRLAGRLTSGGDRVVYLARDDHGALVAVKTTHGHKSEQAQVRRRLRREVACARRVPRSCTPRLLVDGSDQMPPYLISEYVDGPSLEQLVEGHGPLSPERVTALAAAAGRTLAAIHRAGLVHGDIEPANVLLTGEGVMLLDFGAAQEIPGPGESGEIGSVPGSPEWTAPERLAGGPAGPASDVYGWGCVVSYAATGRNPSGRAGGRRAAGQQSELDALDRRVQELVETALAKNPGDRPTAADAADLLSVAGRPPAPGHDDAFTPVDRSRANGGGTTGRPARSAAGSVVSAGPSAGGLARQALFVGRSQVAPVGEPPRTGPAAAPGTRAAMGADAAPGRRHAGLAGTNPVDASTMDLDRDPMRPGAPTETGPVDASTVDIDRDRMRPGAPARPAGAPTPCQANDPASGGRQAAPAPLRSDESATMPIPRVTQTAPDHTIVTEAPARPEPADQPRPALGLERGPASGRAHDMDPAETTAPNGGVRGAGSGSAPGRGNGAESGSAPGPRTGRGPAYPPDRGPATASGRTPDGAPAPAPGRAGDTGPTRVARPAPGTDPARRQPGMPGTDPARRRAGMPEPRGARGPDAAGPGPVTTPMRAAVPGAAPQRRPVDEQGTEGGPGRPGSAPHQRPDREAMTGQAPARRPARDQVPPTGPNPTVAATPARRPAGIDPAARKPEARPASGFGREEAPGSLFEPGATNGSGCAAVPVNDPGPVTRPRGGGPPGRVDETRAERAVRDPWHAQDRAAATAAFYAEEMDGAKPGFGSGHPGDDQAWARSEQGYSDADHTGASDGGRRWGKPLALVAVPVTLIGVAVAFVAMAGADSGSGGASTDPVASAAPGHHPKGYHPPPIVGPRSGDPHSASGKGKRDEESTAPSQDQPGGHTVHRSSGAAPSHPGASRPSHHLTSTPTATPSPTPTTPSPSPSATPKQNRGTGATMPTG